MNRTHLSQLAVLATVAQCGSFRGAAKELGIAPSAVSHAVSSLEARLGVRLLARSTRSVAPTEEGAQLLERLRPALSEIDLALESAVEARDRPAGNLRLTVPRTAAHLALTPRLGAFASAYPDIVLEIVIEDRFTDVVEGGFDAGVRLGESLQRDMIAVRIGPNLRGAVVGAPSYFATMPRPRHPHDLVGHRCIRFRFSSGILYRWEFEKDGEEIELAVQGPLILDEDHLIANAAADGAGLAFLFEDYVREALATGRLIRVLEDWCPPFDGFFAYYPSRRQMRPALRAFVDFFKIESRLVGASSAST
ncbi:MULTISPECIES: LysR family transcriptional regulator [unclassified Mesorhizobium]|jgi:DNA-binding transcriptional LysR family regulator|uniref:LysR family transcriptional regulator n=1 Tax=unclassified Mesorhizobium TaxID=325217 RepID=UPI0003D02E13|nr:MULTISPECIES: LysR family transcriptional regulator [unclassified Mesorhizobium]ESZ22601.1 transcriptional regulator [Mesorhizobium sp. L48C026A00]RWO34091.1 MAG: LysR family transcriptional regulator [Mesorhizobium sp.]RWO37573.1 MAG: LysR family transcriptional regulator [Mesorhizobium sp.]RWO53096.1 MAG: LysR family transcriptional regulator [Mesorhizobium sp.]RWO81309.1 MAG: LysR family transcriptional regulator [Mesorhizobium sp.]